MRTVETLSVPGTLPGVLQAVQAFEQFGRTHALSEGAAWRFLVALDEILSNIVRHGLAGRRDAIDLMFSIDGDDVAVEIIDRPTRSTPCSRPRRTPAARSTIGNPAVWASRWCAGSWTTPGTSGGTTGIISS